MLYKCVQSIVRKHQTNTEKINSYKSDLVDLFRSLGLAPFDNTPCQRSDEEHSRVFQISLDEVYSCGIPAEGERTGIGAAKELDGRP